MNFIPFALAGLIFSASIASAAEAADKAPMPTQIGFFEMLAKGGFTIIPLAVLSVVMVIFIFIFMLTIRRNAIVSDRFMNTAEAMIRKRDFMGLISFSSRRNECMAAIVRKTLDFISSNPGAPFDNVREVAQTEGARQSGMLTSRITYLADIGAIAPMIGLLGTVIGMIKAFVEISTGEVQGVKQMGLAEGVSEALIATACGLAISIVALCSYSYFRGRVFAYIGELEAAATHFIVQLHSQFERQSPAPASSLLVGERPDLHGI